MDSNGTRIKASTAGNGCCQAVKMTELLRLLAELDQTGSETTHPSFGCTDPCHTKAVNTVKLTLGSCDDKFVIYTAQKVLVSLLKHNACQEGIDLIQQMFNDDRQLQNIQTGLQICQQLFSKQSCHRYLVFNKLNSSICKVWNRLTYVVTSNAVSMDSCQCLYECCSIFIKVVKMFGSKPEEKVFELFLKQILSTGFLCDILFHENVKYYVVSKVIQLLCSVIQLGTEKQDVFMQEQIFVSSTVFKNLCSRDLRSTYVVMGNQTFVGIQYRDGIKKHQEAECNHVNVAHLRDWTYLMFTVSSSLIHQQDYVAMVTKYLSELDTFLQEVLNISSSLPFPWLPLVYSEQDDVWINVLLLLLHIYPLDTGVKHTSEISPYRQQHHMHFLKFIGTLGYDHLVLIDLLTSPETKCLSYITKYLKLMYSSWNDFVHVTELLTSTEKDSELLTSTEEDSKLLTSTEDDSGSDKEETSTESRLDELQASISETMCKMAIESPDNTISGAAISTIHSDCDSVTTCNDDRRSTVCKGGGLALIVGAYHDDSEDDVNDNQADYDSTKDDSKSVTDNFNMDKIKNRCLDENRIFECIDHVSGENYKMCANSENENQVNSAHTKLDALFDCIDDTGNEIEVQFDDDDVDNYDADKYKNVLRDLNEDTSGCVSKDNELLDNAMSMLIRTRLKLEKLRDSGLISYNPNVLIHLISSVEDFYEENESDD